jgi:hypothetical protein
MLIYYRVRLNKKFLSGKKSVSDGERRVVGTSSAGRQLAINPNDGSLAFRRVVGPPGSSQDFYDRIGRKDYTEQKITDCKAIAHQTFFPGQGQVQLRDLAGRQLLEKLLIT